MSIDKFLLADNPMREGSTQAIIHMLEPISVLLVNEGHVSTNWPHRHYTYNSGLLTEEYTLSLYHCFTTTFDGEQHNAMIEKLLKKAWHWYMAYMAWEDAQIETDEEE